MRYAKGFWLLAGQPLVSEMCMSTAQRWTTLPNAKQINIIMLASLGSSWHGMLILLIMSHMWLEAVVHSGDKISWNYLINIENRVNQSCPEVALFCFGCEIIWSHAVVLHAWGWYKFICCRRHEVQFWFRKGISCLTLWSLLCRDDDRSVNVLLRICT